MGIPHVYTHTNTCVTCVYTHTCIHTLTRVYTHSHVYTHTPEKQNTTLDTNIHHPTPTPLPPPSNSCITCGVVCVLFAVWSAVAFRLREQWWGNAWGWL
jgi:hypothetical protein